MLKVFLIGAALITSAALPAPVNAQSEEARVKRKTHIVSRVYQLVYGGAEICTRLASPDAQAAVAAAARFKDAYPELIRLVEESPYVGIARERNRKMVEDGVAYEAKNPQPEPDCKDVIRKLDYSVDDPVGRIQINETIERLKE